MSNKFVIDGAYCNHNNSNYVVFVVDISLVNNNDVFDQNDIDFIIMKLNLNPSKFDFAYVHDISVFDSNDNYDLSFFYVDIAKTIYMSIVCKNKEAKEILDKVLDELKNLEGNQRLTEN